MIRHSDRPPYRAVSLPASYRGLKPPGYLSSALRAKAKAEAKAEAEGEGAGVSRGKSE